MLFCVLVNAIVAHIDQNMMAYNSFMRRLHTLTAREVSLDLRVPHRLGGIASYLKARPKQGRLHKAMLLAIDEILYAMDVPTALPEGVTPREAQDEGESSDDVPPSD